MVCAWIVAAVVSTAVAGAAAVTGQAGNLIGSAAPAALGAVSQGQFTEAATAAVNGAVTQAGGQPLAPQQVQAVAHDVTSSAMQQIQRGDFAGAFDEQRLTTIVARDTGMSQQQAQALASRIAGQLRSTITQVGTGAQGAAQQVGQAAASGGSAAAWGGFIFAVLTLIAAAIGGAVAITSRQRRRVAAWAGALGALPLRPQEA